MLDTALESSLASDYLAAGLGTNAIRGLLQDWEAEGHREGGADATEGLRSDGNGCRKEVTTVYGQTRRGELSFALRTRARVLELRSSGLHA